MSTPLTIKIEENVPLPQRSPLPHLPFGKMKVGNSIVINITNPADVTTIKQRIQRYQKKHKSVCLSLRRINETSVRVFRMEDRV